MPLRARIAVLAAALATASVATFAAVPGSPFQPVLPVGAAPWGPFRWLGEAIGFDALGGDAAAVVGRALLVLAMGTFLALVALVIRGEVSLRVVVAFAVIAQLSMLAVPLLFSRDVYSYAAYGRIISVYGANPYLVTPFEVAQDPVVAYIGPKWVDTPSVYGPAWSSISAGIAAIASPAPDDLVRWFHAVGILAGLVTTLLLVPVVRRVAPGREALAVATFGCNPVILFHTLGGAHNDVFVALGIVLAIGLLARGRPATASVVMTLAALIKASAAIPLLLLLAWLALREERGARWRAVRLPLLAAGSATAIVAAPYLQMRDPTLGLLELASHRAFRTPPSGMLANFLGYLFPSSPLLGTIVRGAFAVALFVAIALLVKMGGRQEHRGASDIEEMVASWGWGSFLLLLMAPVLLPWYIAWVVPLAWCLPRARWRDVHLAGGVLSLSLMATETQRPWFVAPILAGLLFSTLRDLWRRSRLGLALRGDPRSPGPRAVGEPARSDARR